MTGEQQRSHGGAEDQRGGGPRLFLYNENPALGVGFREAYSYGGDRKTPFAYTGSAVWQLHDESKRRTSAMANDNKSIAHTKWNCKYHIVFAPKYRRKEFFGEKREAIGKILRQLCEWKGIEIILAEICPGHVHMLVSIPPKIAVKYTHSPKTG